MVKIHIDTSTAEEQAKAKIAKDKAGTTAKGKSGASSSTNKSGAQAQQQANMSPAMPGQGAMMNPMQPQAQKAPMPKSPRKEPKPNDETVKARSNQTDVLKSRLERETKGKIAGATREADTGPYFYPPLNPIY